MERWLLLCCATAVLTAHANSESFVQISSIRARPAELNCVGPGATTYVRVQLYLAGLSDEAKQTTATVNLSVYSAHPSISKIDIRDSTKEVSLAESPALVDFEVVCTSDTLPGVISLGANVTAAPKNVLIKEPVQPPIAAIKITPPN